MEDSIHDVATCIKEAYEEAVAFYEEHKDDAKAGTLSKIVFTEMLRHKLALRRRMTEGR